MFSSRPFSTAIFISLLLHGIFLFQRPYFSFLKKDAVPEKLEISYVNIPQINKQLDLYTKTADDKKREHLPKLPKVNASIKKVPPPFMAKTKEISIRERGNIPKPILLTKPYLEKSNITVVKKKISFFSPDKDKINNSTYLNYYQIVREKIRRAAYQNYTRTEMGEVYLSFVISNDGNLKQTRIVDEKSSFSLYLKGIALQSVKSASPFPNFPKELDYPQLSFNVIVSFEVE